MPRVPAGDPSKVPIAWNRYNDYNEMEAVDGSDRGLLPRPRHAEVGRQERRGRDMCSPSSTPTKTGSDTSKPAMWIDGNIHGNEIQAGEMVLYVALVPDKSYGKNPEITNLLDTYSFYLVPMVNPDGRQYWFDHANTPQSRSRHNRRKIDHDRDGKLVEDSPGRSSTAMGRSRRCGRPIRGRGLCDPRPTIRVHLPLRRRRRAGRVRSSARRGSITTATARSTKTPGGDDMNRNWPGDWQPNYIQGGAGPFPLSRQKRNRWRSSFWIVRTSPRPRVITTRAG